MPGCSIVRALALVLLTPSLTAAESWICLEARHFQIYTTEGERTAREALEVLQQVRSAFTEILGVKLPEDKPVTVIAFRDEREYAPYRVHEGVASYYMSQPQRDFVVMQDLQPEHYSLLLHEYTHVIIHQAGMKLPLWLNEGFAELYGTMKPMGRKIAVGRIIPGRLQVARAGLIDVREILNANGNSPVYHETNRMGIFYAESWALVHMLKFGNGYSSRFDHFLDAVGKGVPSADALNQVYGKSLAQIQADLAAYVAGDHFFEGVINAKLQKSGVAPEVSHPDPLQTAILLAGVQSRGEHRDEAFGQLQKLAEENPDNPAPQEAMAWFQLVGTSPKKAIEPFRKALQLGTRDAYLCLNYAIKLRVDIPESEYVAALRRATEINPELWDAQKLLAAYYFNRQDYSEAVSRLHLVKKLERAQAFIYYRALSVAAFRIGNAEEAKSAASRAQQYARSPEERLMAEEIVRYVNGTPSKPAAGNEPDFLPH